MNNKNIKKIFIYCLYNVITLSAGIALCCDFNLILNSSDKEPPLPNMNALFSYIAAANPKLNIIDLESEEITKPLTITGKQITIGENNYENLINTTNKNHTKEIQKIENEYIEIDFSSIDTEKKYIDISKKLPKEAYVTVTCDIINCGFKKSGELGEVRCNLLSHKLTEHVECYKANRKRKNTKSSDYDNKKYIKLNFESINTEEKYKTIYSNLDRGSLVIITCNQKGCGTRRSGVLPIARSNMITHLKTDHFICKCNRQCKSLRLLKNCNCKAKK